MIMTDSCLTVQDDDPKKPFLISDRMYCINKDEVIFCYSNVSSLSIVYIVTNTSKRLNTFIVYTKL